MSGRALSAERHGHPGVAFLDAGQTGTKARLSDGVRLIQRVLPGVRTDAPLAEQLAGLIRELVQDCGQPVRAVVAGVSGLTDQAFEAEQLLKRVDDIGVDRVVLAHDSVTSYLGALGDSYGAVVAAGTGVVTLGVGPTRVARVDGWGNIMGDAGSGYWMGRAGLEAGMRAIDGRATPSRLTELITERWADPQRAYIDLQQDPDRVRTVASFARRVIELAPVDAAADAICLAAARELSLSVNTALRAVGGNPDAWHGAPAVAAVGGLFDAETMRDRFRTVMHESRPDAVLIAARGNGLDGVQLLPGLAVDHPLRLRVADATSPAFGPTFATRIPK